MIKGIINKLFILPVLGVSLLFVFLALDRDRIDPHSVERETSGQGFSSPLRIKGLHYKTYDNNRLKASIVADEFVVRNRKFWMFNIRPFKEAVLENAVFHVYQNRDRTSGGDKAREEEGLNLLSFGSDILAIDKKGKSALIEKGIVTKGVIRGLVLKIYETDKLSMLVRANKADVDFRKNRVKMTYVNMEHVPSGKTIKSSSAVWNSKEKVFEINGSYTAQTQDGMTNGRKIKVDLDFDITPLNYNHS